MKNIVLIFLLLAAGEASASWVSEKINKAEKFVAEKADKALGYVDRHVLATAKEPAVAITKTAEGVADLMVTAKPIIKETETILALVKWPLFAVACGLAVWAAALAGLCLKKLAGF